MMTIPSEIPCPYFERCGGCAFSVKETENYRKEKYARVKRILASVVDEKLWGTPRFISAQTRRRAAFAFSFENGHVAFGFNEKASSQIVPLENCLLLTPELNKIIPAVQNLLEKICRIKICYGKGRKTVYRQIKTGDLRLSQVENGIDIVLVSDIEPNLEMRETIAEFVQNIHEIIRFSLLKNENAQPETLAEKATPFLLINNYQVFIPAGTFLQPSSEGEDFLRQKAEEFLADTTGKAADLFCGMGTFTYQLCRNPKLKITAADSSQALTEAFQKSLRKNQISNVTVLQKNLFKYPLQEEISDCRAVIIDPPRAGAGRQIEALCALPSPPEKVVMVSCNPHSLLKDADTLLKNGYSVRHIFFLDQFIYSNHSEVIALFTK